MLRLHLLLNRPYYEPGGNVVSTVQVYNDPEAASAAPIRIRELVFLSAGFERTDANWISSLYKPEAAIEHTDARRGVRTLFRTDGAMLMRNWELQMGAAHQFTIKFRLPGDLPPTFRGSSIRFNYSVDVKALYESDPGQPAPSTPPPLYETTATTSLLVWPTPTTWGSIMLKRQQPPLQQQQQQQQQQQLQQPPTQALQTSPFSSRTDSTTGAGKPSPVTDGPTAEPAASTLPPSPSTPAPPNSNSTTQQKGHLSTALALQTPPVGGAGQGAPPNSNSTTTQQQRHLTTATAPPSPPEREPSQGAPSSAAAAAVAPAPPESDRLMSAAVPAPAESNRSMSAAAPAPADSARSMSAVPADKDRSMSAAPADRDRSMSAAPTSSSRSMSAAPTGSSRSMSAAAAVGSSILKGPLKVFAPCAPQVLPSAAIPLRSIAETGEDDGSDVVQPLLAPSPGGSQQLESASTSRRPSISGNISLLRRNSSSSSSYGVGAQVRGWAGGHKRRKSVRIKVTDCKPAHVIKG
ncbi:hypothetical protein DUNSADRAFT_10111 [Dunaliella salina]|uniref:Encoded protein n=1 Tax=Dunaliella salina TaxID=3046 RepID=A0ABQ7H501_DUNSA|nr:hypothetical protein DUNSADRAFT_10111 [Dunaliella salina]|eukprot:KAF5841940.1 hypothetical protein DUNSADRAFT_10111 [Dunaliella salina]